MNIFFYLPIKDHFYKTITLGLLVLKVKKIIMIYKLYKIRNKIIEIFKTEGFNSVLKRPFRYIKLLFFIEYTKLKIQKINKNFLIDKLVDFSFTINKGFIKPLQIRFEILELLKILKKEKPKVILEIGTASGGTLFLFTRIADNNAIIISIDLPHGSHGGGYPKWKTRLYKAFALYNQKMHLIRADSHDINTLKIVKTILKDKELDFLFIDGDHRYESVKKDFEMYSTIVKKNGIIAFHDIVIHNIFTNTQVNDYWNEIKNKYINQEIVEDWKQKLCGIGILRYNK